MDSLNISLSELQNWDIVLHEVGTGTYEIGSTDFGLRGKNNLNDTFLSFYYDPSFLLCHTGSRQGDDRCNSFLPSSAMIVEHGSYKEYKYMF